MLDPGLTTTSLSSYRLIQFARAVGLEVNLASLGLFEDLLFHARSVGFLEVRVQSGCSLSFSLTGSAVGDSEASHSKFSLPTVFGCTPKVASADTGRRFRVQRSAVASQFAGSRLLEAFTTASVEDVVPLAALSRSLRTKSRRKEDLFKLSLEFLIFRLFKFFNSVCKDRSTGLR